MIINDTAVRDYANVLICEYVEYVSTGDPLVIPDTFGAWVMKTHYPEVPRTNSIEEFTHAQRTRDANYYLLGMLRSGELPLPPA